MSAQGSALTNEAYELLAPLYAVSDQPGGDIDHQRQQRRIEEERDDPMDEREPARGAGAYRHIRSLRGRAEHEGKVQKVQVLRF